MIEDLFSRTLVANEVHAAELAAALLGHASLSERSGGRPLVLQSENGGAMKGSSMLTRMQHLGVAPSFSRPGSATTTPTRDRCSEQPRLPYVAGRPFETLEQARAWVADFAR